MLKHMTTAVLTLALFAGIANAQPQNMKIDDGPGKRRIKIEKELLPKHLNLTDEQKKAFKKLDLDLQKEILPLHNELDVKRLELDAEKTEEKPDLKKINALIDDIHHLAATIEKKRTAVNLQKRALLDDEQRELWDTEGPFDGPRPRLLRNRLLPHRFMWLGDDSPAE